MHRYYINRDTIKWYISLPLVILCLYLYFRMLDVHHDGPVVIQERFITAFDRSDNIDSLVMWHSDDKDWIIATAKAMNSLLIYDLRNGGTFIRRQLLTGARRPNGLALLPDRNDLLLSVERDGHRVTIISLPDFKVLHTFAEHDLRRPYGIDIVIQIPRRRYTVYVTDNYMDLAYSPKHKAMRPRKVPDMKRLNERVVMYDLAIAEDGVFTTKLLKKFGDTAGDGVLNIVETVQADAQYNRLLIADEHERVIKVYSLDGHYTGTTIGRSVFKGEPEGFVLLQCGERNGYWLATDQLKPRSQWHLFERDSLQYVGTFQGVITSNTDGVALSTREGLFCAAHGDASVACFDVSEILSNLNLRCGN